MMSKAERLLKATSVSQEVALAEVNRLLDGRGQATVVMSVMADEKKVTRSIIVAALRMAEVAGIVDCRSCGMKGTHVNVVDKEAWAELMGRIGALESEVAQ